METFQIDTPAKINLYLEVVRRRGDGYHELRSLMCAVGLYDTLTLTFGVSENAIVCDHPDLPCDTTNLALKAALDFNSALASQTDIEPEHVFIDLVKRIPAGAGLGGGSSDAAAVLKQLNACYGHPFDAGQLIQMALALGADVPFFIDSRPALATGVGEVLTPFDSLSPMGVVLVYPGFGVSTAQVFENHNLALTKYKKTHNYSPFKQGKFDPERHLCNDLEAGVMTDFPVLEQIKKDLLNQGAMGALMTGSGTTIYGLYAGRTAADQAVKVWHRPPEWQVFATELIC